MLYFYDVDDSYISFLKKYDSQIPTLKYVHNDKFVCGIVLHINGINYVAPISSKIRHDRTSFIIKDKQGNGISSIRLCFMFPVKFDFLTRKDFDVIKLSDPNYANLLMAEYAYCKNHEQDIMNLATKVYNIGCNKTHWLNKVCCDFKLLESVYLQYDNSDSSSIAPYKT